MTTPAKVLAALFPEQPALTPADLEAMLADAHLIGPLPPMSGLTYAALEWLGHILTSDEARRPNMMEYASAYLLMRLEPTGAHRVACATNAAEAVASATATLLSRVGYAELPRIARAVNAALQQALALAPQDTPAEGDGPLPAG